MVVVTNSAFARAAELAQRYKAVPVEGEVIGLLPEAACERNSEWMRQLIGFDPQTRVLENRLAHPLTWPELDRSNAVE